jgi:sugar phosphate isomerase/epimerase
MLHDTAIFLQQTKDRIPAHRLKFGIASRLLWSYPLNDVIATAESLHYEGVEVWAEHYVRDRAKKSRLAFGKSSLIFTLHAFSFDVNITSMNGRIRRESMLNLHSLPPRIRGMNSIPWRN